MDTPACPHVSHRTTRLRHHPLFVVHASLQYHKCLDELSLSVETVRATNNDNIKWVFPKQGGVFIKDQSQCPILTLGDSSASQRQPSSHHLSGWWSHALRAPSHQRDCYSTQTGRSGESASLCKIKLESTKFFLFSCVLVVLFFHSIKIN